MFSISHSPVPDVTVMITTPGSAVVGMSYTLTCTVSGADNLEATITYAFTGPNSVSGTGTSLQLPLTLDLNDAGRYTCTATVSSGLLTNNLTLTDTEDVNIPSEPLSAVVVIAVSENYITHFILNSLWKRNLAFTQHSLLIKNA